MSYKSTSKTFIELKESSGTIPLIRSNLFLVGSFMTLTALGATIFKIGGEGLGIYAGVVLFIALLISWTIIIITDEQLPNVFKTGTAFLVTSILFALFVKFIVTDISQISFLFFNAEVIKDSWAFIEMGFWTTVKLAFCTAILSTSIGIALAVFQSFNNRVLNFFIIAYVDFFRAIPIIVLLMLIYYGLPFMNIKLSAFASGVLGLGLNSGAYVSEIFRAGFMSVDKGQIEASRALGLSSWQTVIKVLLPQAFKAITPPLVSNYVSSAKDTALCSSISIIELLKAGTAQQSLQANPSPLIFVAGLYLVLFLPLTRFTGYLENRMKRTERSCNV